MRVAGRVPDAKHGEQGSDTQKTRARDQVAVDIAEQIEAMHQA